MRKTLSVLLALIASYFSLSQSHKTDSLSQLIANATDNTIKAGLLLQRSKAWPNSQVEKPMTDAQQGLSYYQQTKNEEGQVEAYLQISALYARQSKYKLALDFDSTAYTIATQNGLKKATALSLGSMGRSNQQLGNFKQSEQNCLQALKLFMEEGLESETAETHNRLGVVYRRLSDHKKSLHHYDEGIRVAKKYNNNAVLAVLYMNKANTLHESSRYDEAIDMHLQSIRIKEKIKDERGLLQSYNNIALVYMRTSQFEPSIEYFKKANSLARQFNSKTALGYNNVNLATLYIQLGKTDSVPHFFEQAMAAFKETAEKPGLGLVYHNYGNYLLDRKQFDESEDMLRKALEVRKEIQSKYDIASTMNVLGSALTQKGKMKEAEDLLLQSLALLKDENSTRQKEVYGYLASHYKTAAKFEEAYKYQAGYISMKDTLMKEDEILTMLKMQSQYEVEKKDVQLALAEKGKQLQAALVSKKDQQLLYLLVALGLALLLSLVFFWSYREKRKHATALQNKNSQIETLIRELHHRVKNNLQVVSGLLSLQSSYTEDEGARQVMEEGRTRVNAMAMIHQKLYMDKELAAVDIKEYLQNLSSSLADSFGHSASTISTQVKLPKATIDIDKAIPIGLIVNELVTNAFKHAFDGLHTPEIVIRLAQAVDGMELMIADNGKGNFAAENKSGSFGMKLVHTLVRQLDAQIEVENNNGTTYRIKMRA